MFGFKKDKPLFNPGNRATGVDEDYVAEEVTKIEEGDVEVVLQNEESINKKFSGSNNLKKYAELGTILVSMLKDIKKGNYRSIPWFTIATVVFALMYILNPLDLVPDFIPGLGYIDDVAVLTIGVGWIESDLHRYLNWKLEQGKGI